MPQTHRQNIIYQAFRCYLRFFHDRVFYKRVYRIGVENMPAEGKPLLVTSNHQNCLNDPLGLIFCFRDRKPHILARADVIEYNCLTRKFLRSIGLLPTFRLNFDGEEALARNNSTFSESETSLIDGNTIIMFPEGVHQDKRWLGPFSSGYTKMAFEAAQMDNFQTEVFILPCCNHYSDYYGIQNELIIKIGKPVSIAPFYELYKTKPRTAQREVSALVFSQIESMMLDITDLDNYEAIDFLRGIYGRRFASANNLNPNHFPDQLEADKMLVAQLDSLKAEKPDAVASIYSKALEYKQMLTNSRITDLEVGRNATSGQTAANLFSLIVLAPFWIICLWPALFIYCAPLPITKRLKDKMFEGTIRYTMSVLLTIPLFYGLSFALVAIYANVLFAIIYIAMLPFIGIFAWNYWQFAKRTCRMVRFRRLSADKRQSLNGLRKSIVEKLDGILGVGC
ncbi:MAG: 1-acyl-sn-glycerol-3-phosphate acyltransferase [Salinivirgaceae bacterium]|nr:1-acyl-sn-glycerol-3-phosphate acyltransferase [Salinivirgaceae bacterium]